MGHIVEALLGAFQGALPQGASNNHWWAHLVAKLVGTFSGHISGHISGHAFEPN